jgi:uncharacterized membrane protein YebE (DUF533 family)
LETQAQAQAQAREQGKTEKGVLGNMSSWLHRQAGSQTSQLGTTAVLSGAAVAGAIFGYQAYKRKEAVHDLKASIPSLDDEHPAVKVSCKKRDFEPLLRPDFGQLGMHLG